MSCYISTGCFKTNELNEIVTLADKHGFDLELSSSLSFSHAMLEPLFSPKSRVGYLIHNYFPPPAIPFVLNLASSDPVIYGRSVGLCREAIDLCVRLGVPCYSFHAGFTMDMYPDMLGNPLIQKQACLPAKIDREKSYWMFVDTVLSLAEYAAGKRVKLFVENNVLPMENIASDGTYPLLLAEVDEIRTFFNDLNCPDVGLLLDVGHAKVSAKTCNTSPKSYFDELGPFISCLHLSDNNGLHDTNDPLGLDSWFVPFLKQFGHVPMVIEVNHRPLDEILEQRKMVISLLT
jgi:sugar phosphate isomerase/epimerase